MAAEFRPYCGAVARWWRYRWALAIPPTEREQCRRCADQYWALVEGDAIAPPPLIMACLPEQQRRGS